MTRIKCKIENEHCTLPETVPKALQMQQDKCSKTVNKNI